MNNSGNSKWVCVKNDANDGWFTVGKAYIFTLEDIYKVTDDSGYNWSLHPDDFAPNVQFTKPLFNDYLKELER